MSDDELAGEGDTVVLAPGEEEEPLKKLTHVHQGVLQAFMAKHSVTAEEAGLILRQVKGVYGETLQGLEIVLDRFDIDMQLYYTVVNKVADLSSETADATAKMATKLGDEELAVYKALISLLSNTETPEGRKGYIKLRDIPTLREARTMRGAKLNALVQKLHFRGRNDCITLGIRTIVELKPVLEGGNSGECSVCSKFLVGGARCPRSACHYAVHYFCEKNLKLKETGAVCPHCKTPWETVTIHDSDDDEDDTSPRPVRRPRADANGSRRGGGGAGAGAGGSPQSDSDATASASEDDAPPSARRRIGS